MQLQLQTWPDVETYLKRSDGIILPIGSTEQHGPIGLIGTDALCAEIIARGVGETLQLRVVDRGPGIPDLDLAMKDGWTSGGGLGKGLSGSKRLVNEFELESTVGQGTRVTITRWK